MALGKYFEDNCEIIAERHYYASELTWWIDPADTINNNQIGESIIKAQSTEVGGKNNGKHFNY